MPEGNQVSKRFHWTIKITDFTVPYYGMITFKKVNCYSIIFGCEIEGSLKQKFDAVQLCSSSIYLCVWVYNLAMGAGGGGWMEWCVSRRRPSSTVKLLTWPIFVVRAREKFWRSKAADVSHDDRNHLWALEGRLRVAVLKYSMGPQTSGDLWAPSRASASSEVFALFTVLTFVLTVQM